VAVEVLLFAAHFSECFFQGRKIENRVVTETAGATRLVEDLSLGNGGQNAPGLSITSQSDNADESRAAIAVTRCPQLAEQFADALRIGRMRTGIARRMHAGRAAERGDDQARIVGNDRLLRESDCNSSAFPAAFSAKVGADSSNCVS
jgi:hypothetical protein